MDTKSREEYCTFLVGHSLAHINESQEKYEEKIKERLSAEEADIFRYAFIAGGVSVGIFLTDEQRGN